MKGSREGETVILVSFRPVEEQGSGKWELQSQQRGAQQGAKGLLGRMQAKGIVGNYTGLLWASNALIQWDIFIKKRGRRMTTKRESE